MNSPEGYQPIPNKEKQPIYNEEGRVNDPEIAFEGASIENKYRKKIFGLFPQSEKTIEEGKIAAEIAMEKGFEIDLDKVPQVVNSEIERVKESVKVETECDDEDIRVDKVIESDIGGGIHRYRIYMAVEDFVMDLLLKMPGTGLNDEEFILTVDIKDGDLVKSSAQN